MKLIPELRFPEFENDGEWSKTTVEKLIQKNILFPPKDGNHGNIHPKSADYVKSGIPFIMASDLKNGKVDFSKCAYLRKEQADSLQKGFAKSGDVLLTHKGTVGEVAMLAELEFPYIMLTPQVTYYRIKDKSKLLNEFLAVFFNSYFFQRNLLDVSGGGTRAYVGITKQQLFEVHHPKKVEEQKKIASCLSTLEELIAAHIDKQETLKDHKKGLMQNLFPQKGQEVPNYRFSEFEDDDEWVGKKLGDKEVSGFVNDKIDSKKLTLNNYISTDNMLPDYSGITDASKLPTTSRVTEFIEGDILISNIRPYLKKVWKSDRQGGASNDVLVFRSGSKVKSEFLEFILKNDAFINYVMLSAKGVKMPRGDKGSMLEYPIRIPSKDEQQKVASCLSVLDMLITAQSEKIEQLQHHKKGLMQGLFPKKES